jgi:hypothetical protein
VTNQRVLDPGNDQGKSEYSASEREGTDSVLLGTTGDPIADDPNDAGARIAGPVKLAIRRRDQDWHADYYRHGGGRGKLDSRDDPIAPWDPPIVNQPTSNAEREQMRKSEADGSAPDQAHDPARDSSRVLERGQRSDQTDGHIESHGPALLAEMITMSIVGLGDGFDGRRSGVIGHAPILAG